MKSLLQILIQKLLFRSGYSDHYAQAFSRTILNDLFTTDLPIKKKLWAYKRGFLSYKIDYFGLTPKNYKSFLACFDYYRLHPINGHFSHWVDDKLTIRYILEPYKEFLPEYYFHLYDGEVLCLPDCPNMSSNSMTSILDLLEKEKVLAAKLLNKSQGEGFFKLEFTQNGYLINNQLLSKKELIILLENWRDEIGGGYIITKFLRPCQEFSQIWGKSANTVRITTIRNKNESAKVVDGFIRFGTKDTDFTDSTNHGAVTCLIDTKDGTFSDGVIINHHKIIESKFHPDTGLLVEGIIPNWDFVKGKIIEICNYMPHVIFMGFDIVFTDQGFKIIEINSQQGLAFNQIYKPYLENKETKAFFSSLIYKKKQELDNKKAAKLLGKIILLLKKFKHQMSQSIINLRSKRNS
jgi:hypothetical protein